MPFDPVPAATALLKIRRDRVPVSPLPSGIAPTTEAKGAAVQVALAGLMGAVPPVGFKIGATGKRMQAYLGVDTPIAGFMRREDVYHSSAALRFDDFIKPGVECEVAVRLARDLPPGPCSLDQALAAVGSFFAGIEIVENRYGNLAELGTPTLLADQMYHCAAVISDWHEVDRHGVDWRGLDIGALRGRISLDDGIADDGVTSDLLGHPLNGLAWLAGSAEAAAFGGLRAGQVVMLGSVTPPVWLTGPATVTVAFPPLPAVTVRLS
jgi:2-keto-4-pentenoate hydratase